MTLFVLAAGLSLRTFDEVVDRLAPEALKLASFPSFLHCSW